MCLIDDDDEVHMTSQCLYSVIPVLHVVFEDIKHFVNHTFILIES